MAPTTVWGSSPPFSAESEGSTCLGIEAGVVLARGRYPRQPNGCWFNSSDLRRMRTSCSATRRGTTRERFAYAFEWRWWLYGDETGEFEWKDRERDRSREGDIEWTSDGDSYEVVLTCKEAVGDDCWSRDREYECELKKNDSAIDCERTDDDEADFELERE